MISFYEENDQLTNSTRGSWYQSLKVSITLKALASKTCKNHNCKKLMQILILIASNLDMNICILVIWPVKQIQANKQFVLICSLYICCGTVETNISLYSVNVSIIITLKSFTFTLKNQLMSEKLCNIYDNIS